MSDSPHAYLRVGFPSAFGAAPEGEWRSFSQPVKVVTTHQRSEVRACLREVESLCASGLHAVGFVSYEAAPAFEGAFPVRSDPDFPLVYFALFAKAESVAPASTQPFSVGPWQCRTPRAEYDAAIGRIRDEIARGNTYQTNYTARLTAPFAGDALSYFGQLYGAQPTEYAAYINMGRWSVLSVSPELFFARQGQTLTTRPMKGTVPRGATVTEDQAQADWLRQSEKNRAENVMIVDLLRNDMGRVAEFGSVEVTALCELETYPTLHTLTSTIRATLRPEVGLSDLFAALFPCGSVTGAPKISTMHLIDQLEPQPRRVYCGAIGYMAPNGDATFNVPIRTVLIDHAGHTAEYGAGGGITWDSDAAGEYEELLTKARILEVAAPDFCLLETVRLEGGVVSHQAEHLERLAASAAHFGFPFAPDAVQAELSRAANESPAGRFRLRLLLHSDGKMTHEAYPLGEYSPEVRAHLAASAVDSSQVWLHHKTTRRDIYEWHLAQVPTGDEVLLWNERGEITEFTTGNIIIELGGVRYTPPTSCGLLPGVARRLALAGGEVQERVLSWADVQNASAVWHINSLRGWRRVRFEKDASR